MVRGLCMALSALALSGLSAQSDTIFPNVSGSWQYTEFYYLGNGDPPEALNSWSQQYSAEPSFELDGFGWGTLQEDGEDIGRIAVDSGRVYFRALEGWDGDTNLVHVLYDFNLSVWDTAYLLCGDWEVEVHNVDTMILSGRERSRFELLDGGQWIEGIGSLGGLLSPLFCPCVECYYEMQEFCGSYVDMEGEAYTICWPQNDGLSALEEVDACIIPNPSNGEFFITLREPLGNYRVCDTRGVQVASGRLEGASSLVRLTSAPPGLYILEVNGHQAKLIIQ